LKVIFDIYRYDSSRDKEGRFERTEIDAGPEERVLDALLQAHAADPSLGLRRSCGHGVCGSDAMRINGKERLACKTLIKDVATEERSVVRVEPLRHLPVKRDLMVDQSQLFARNLSVKPFLLPAAEPAAQDGQEILQTPLERERIDDPSKCIQCGACYSACPVLDKNPRFIGPLALVQAARFVEDTRDKGLEPRMDVLDQPDGVWSCENHFECTRVCPRGIKVTRLINMLKSRIKAADRGTISSQGP